MKQEQLPDRRRRGFRRRAGPERSSRRRGERLLGLVRQHVRGADDLELEKVTVGMRPMPEDGMPVVGFAPDLPGLYLATMHSGITLAPAVGRFAAMEILDGVRVDMLEPYRPERCAGHSLRPAVLTRARRFIDTGATNRGRATSCRLPSIRA